MVLLTSSSVSAIVSMGVICIFTALLFLSGYVLQQQSVKNIQHALKPQEAAQKAKHKSGPAFKKPLKRGGVSDTGNGADEDVPIIGRQPNYRLMFGFLCGFLGFQSMLNVLDRLLLQDIPREK
jgi:hypothetical protein